MPDQTKLMEAVNDAARSFNRAVSEAADAGLLVEVALEDDPELTTGATPRPMLAVNVRRPGASGR